MKHATCNPRSRSSTCTVACLLVPSPLPPSHRLDWRADSGIKDGSDSGIDLVGGYYDAGDNVKFNFPMAYTITMLGWSVVEFQNQLAAKNELKNALAAVRWGTDYIVKAHPQLDVLYGKIGDGDSDHDCWERPEDMTTPRTSYKIDDGHTGSDLAGESAAALAAASIAFAKSDAQYSSQLITHAKQLFDFARNHPGVYSNSISAAAKFYASSGYEIVNGPRGSMESPKDMFEVFYIDYGTKKLFFTVRGCRVS